MLVRAEHQRKVGLSLRAPPIPKNLGSIRRKQLHYFPFQLSYEYVLTADDGLLQLTPQIGRYNHVGYLQRTNLPFRQYHVDVSKVLPEFHQMKFVCRLLYNETESLELKYNTLVLERAARAEMEPDRQLLNFKGLCSPAIFSWINSIELHIKALAMPGSEILRYFLLDRHLDVYVRAAQFCRQHLELDVK